jgi:hypothetical protein
LLIEHCKNELLAMFGLPDIFTVVRLEHWENAYEPIDVTLEGMTNAPDRLAHPLNAYWPISDTVFGITTEVMLVLFLNTPTPLGSDAIPIAVTV